MTPYISLVLVFCPHLDNQPVEVRGWPWNDSEHVEHIHDTLQSYDKE